MSALTCHPSMLAARTNGLTLSLLLMVFAGIDVLAQNSTFINYSMAEGLNHSQISDISQDDFGSLWLLPYSSSSIYQFDGLTFKRSIIKVPGVESVIKPYRILADGDRRVLLLTNIGVVEFNGRSFQAVSSGDTIHASFNSVLYLDSKSTFWIIDQSGSLFFQSAQSAEMRRFQNLDDLPLGFFEFSGELFVYTEKSEVISLVSGKKTELPWLKSYPNFKGIAQEGSRYFVMTEDKVVSFNAGTGVAEETKIDAWMINRFSQVISDDDGTLWLLTNGVVRRLGKEGVQVIGKDAGFTDVFIHKIFKDDHGSIWFCTDTEGVYYYVSNQSLSFFSNGDAVVNLVAQKERMLCGTAHHGVIAIEENHFREKIFAGLQTQHVATLADGPAGTLLVGTLGEGLYAVDRQGKPRKIAIQSSIPGSQNIYKIVFDGKNVWALSQNALHRLDSRLQYLKSYDLYEQFRIQSDVNFIYLEDEANLFLGSSGDGLFRFSIPNEQIQSVPNFTRASVLYGVRKDPQGSFWFSGEFPFLLVQDFKRNFQKQIDLSRYCSNVWTLEFTGKNEVLIGSTDGIFKVLLDPRLDVVSIKKFGKPDGYRGGEIFIESMVKTENEIWFGTSKGAYRYKAEKSQGLGKVPRTYIREVELLDSNARETYSHTRGMHGLPEDLKIPYGATSLRFSFFANDSYHSASTQYRYQLEGLEENWSGFSNVNQIAYSNLNPGHYTFKVQSRGESMMIGNVAGFSFEVLPAFWQTVTFRVAASIAIVVLLIVVIRYSSLRRLRQYRLTEEIRSAEIGKLRKQMAMDFHDEMGNKLAGILAYINSLKFKASRVQSEDLIDYLEENAAAVYHGTKDFIWSIDVESNNLREVISYIRDFGVNFFEKHGIEFIVEKDILAKAFDKPLADGHNRHIILLFKEAMTNILKHSQCSKVYFGAVVIGRQCQIMVEDNGVGMREKRKGKGLFSMSDRARRVNGIVRFLNKEPQGTSVILEFIV